MSRGDIWVVIALCAAVTAVIKGAGPVALITAVIAAHSAMTTQMSPRLIGEPPPPRASARAATGR